MPKTLRSEFDLPSAVAYLDAAAISPRALRIGAIGHAAVDRTVRPWAHRNVDKASLLDQLRQLAGALVGAAPADMAVVSAVSYGIATAAANLSVPSGTRILCIEGDHPSAVLVWETIAKKNEASLRIVPRPANGDWTTAILSVIGEPGHPPISVAVLPPVHWADGALVDLNLIAPVLQRNGSALVVDATQAAGVLPIDVKVIQPDFLAFPAYKWLLGPYGCAFLYVHPKHHAGRPLEEHMSNRRRPALAQAEIAPDMSFRLGAERFDRGERDDWMLISSAIAGIETLLSMPADHRLVLLRQFTQRIAQALRDVPVDLVAEEMRSPHILSIGLRGRDATELTRALEHAHVFASPRLGKLRVSPHVYNETVDVDQFLSAFIPLVARK